ncbi:type IV pilus secretin PilQ [Limnohabitans sp.]|uniref:type IV pilus secretin PilQ n=1 Tax=Limnohabitans sp. TaxID=1907725 RepID=UPI0035AFA034
MKNLIWRNTVPMALVVAVWGWPAWAQWPGRLQEPANSDPISLNFQNTEVRALMQVFADFTGLNFVTTDSVTGQVSVRLQEVPWPQALQVVLQAKGLAARQDGRVVWIAPHDEWLQREKKSLEAQAALEGVSPLQMASVRLQYARASEVAQRLQGLAPTGGVASGGRWLSARGSVMAEPRTNQLFISDVPARVAELQQIVAKLDVPVRQVLIEARIVEADDQFGESLGVRLGVGVGRNVQINGQATSVGQLGATNAVTGAGAVSGNQVAFPAGAAGQTLVNPASVAVSLFNAAADRFINLELSALEADGRGKVVSRPRVITADQTKALIEQGTELPYQTAATSGGSTLTNITFRKANLKLEVTPQITPEGAVVLDVDVNRDSVGQLTTAGYAINTKHVKTQVRVQDGGTVVLGGIFEDTDKNDEARVPGLGEVPVLGWLFRNRQQVRRRSELLVFLTPRVVAENASVAEMVGPVLSKPDPRP